MALFAPSALVGKRQVDASVLPAGQLVSFDRAEEPDCASHDIGGREQSWSRGLAPLPTSLSDLTCVRLLGGVILKKEASMRVVFFGLGFGMSLALFGWLMGLLMSMILGLGVWLGTLL